MAKSTFNRVALKSVIIVRDGRRVSPPLGKSFPFTEEEVEAIEKTNPTAIREAVNEDEAADAAEVVHLGMTNTRVNTKNVANGAGKTTGMADGFDGTGKTPQGGEGGEKPLTVAEIKEGLATLDNDGLTTALNAERAGGNRPTAIAAYEAEIAKRNAPDDDL